MIREKYRKFLNKEEQKKERKKERKYTNRKKERKKKKKRKRKNKKEQERNKERTRKKRMTAWKKNTKIVRMRDQNQPRIIETKKRNGMNVVHSENRMRRPRSCRS